MNEGVAELWGLMAVFESPEELLDAVRATQGRGFLRFDAYSPFPLDEVADAMEIRPTGVAAICWAGGFIGATSAFTILTWDTVVSFALNSGGHPYFSWPAYVPITFEVMVLTAGVLTFLGVLGLNGLPRYHHPVFNVEEFQRRGASDGFFLVIEASDRHFSPQATRDFLAGLNPTRIHEVPAE